MHGRDTTRTMLCLVGHVLWQRGNSVNADSLPVLLKATKSLIFSSTYIFQKYLCAHSLLLWEYPRNFLWILIHLNYLFIVMWIALLRVVWKNAFLTNVKMLVRSIIGKLEHTYFVYYIIQSHKIFLFWSFGPYKIIVLIFWRRLIVSLHCIMN